MNRKPREAIPVWLIAVAVFGVTAAAWVSGLSRADDRSIVAWAVAGSGREPWLTFWKGITALGDWPGWLGVVAVVVGVAAGLSIGRSLPISPSEGMAWSGLAIGGLALKSLLKAGFDRDRPPIEWRRVVETTPSFPSGHASFAAAAFGLLACLAWRAARPRSAGLAVSLVLVCGVLAVLVAASRVALGVHYPTDVLGGLALGVAWVDGSRRLIRAGARRSG